jgi:mRNA interferase MazF
VAIRRGDLASVALPGDFGKPRPALIVQSDHFEGHPTVTVLPLTSSLRDAPLLRITLRPDAANGLRAISQVMIDKAMTVRRERLGDAFGRVAVDAMLEIERRLALFLGIAK